MHTTSLYIFQNDCRLHDNATLVEAAKSSKQLVCTYIVDPRFFTAYPYSALTISSHRWHFLKQSLDALHKSLQKLGQTLHVIFDHSNDAIAKLITQYNLNAIYLQQGAASYEHNIVQHLKKHYPLIDLHTPQTHTLFNEEDFPFALNDLPTTFSKFRKIAEKLPIKPPLDSPQSLPPAPKDTPNGIYQMPDYILKANNTKLNNLVFSGGEHAALSHLEAYFESSKPQHYKEVRNALDGFDNSTKFSPWLANGNVSVRQIHQRLKTYERNITANSSTYWIYFELLWREYFFWYAKTHQNALFALKGIKHKPPLTSFYPNRFKQWTQGSTPYPIVNAIMNQLNETGYISNRARQIAASCFINELGLDWRYGAAYFEEKLIDYDVGSNWGNWQYQAGVGADAKEKRHFNLQKQTDLFDPKKAYINKYHGEDNVGKLDYVDAADWPIE